MTTMHEAHDVHERGPHQPFVPLTDADIMRKAGRILGRLKRGEDVETCLKKTLELILDMHREAGSTTDAMG